MSFESTAVLETPPTSPPNVGTPCDCGTVNCPDFADHDRERRASESTWMRNARRPAFPSPTREVA